MNLQVNLDRIREHAATTIIDQREDAIEKKKTEKK